MSSSATATLSPRAKVDLSSIDQRVFLHDVPWEEYERLLEVRGESSVPRMTYLEGELELMTPSHHHEGIKTRLARLLETWGEEAGVELYGVGSWTIKQRREERGAEADECYLIDPDPSLDPADDDAWPRRPDLAIEVVWTSGGIPKLEVWRKLGVPEVWIWQADRLTLHALRGERYQEIPASELLPDLDLELLLRFLETPPGQTAAVRAYRAALKAAAK
ncbi:MAG: Uma2 family endonuclease [Thermoanaerobaculia bacterium]